MIIFLGNGWRLQRHIKYPNWWKVLYHRNPIASIYIKAREFNGKNVIDVNDKLVIPHLAVRKIKKRTIYLGESIRGVLNIETKVSKENTVLFIAEKVEGKPLVKILNPPIYVKKIVLPKDDGEKEVFLVRIIVVGEGWEYDQ